MAAKKIRSVGLVVVARLHEKRYALLQVRGYFDPKKFPAKTSQSWPGICRVSAYGSVEPSDQDDVAALVREVREKLGEPLASRVVSQRWALNVVSHADRPGEDVITYDFPLPWEALGTIPRGAFGLRLVSSEEVMGIQDAYLIAQGKQRGAPDNRIWMFPEEREAVQKALE